MPGTDIVEEHVAGIAIPRSQGEMPVSLFGRVKRLALRYALRFALAVHAVTVRLLRLAGTRPLREDGLEILLTGTFHSENWVRAHLVPLAASGACRRVRVVSCSAVPAAPKVERVAPPAWLVRTIGEVPARLLTFAALAVRTRPDFVGGFHLLFNGLAASALARLTRARSLYFCVGGPAEVLDGGLWSENRLFTRLGARDATIERQLVRAVGQFDLAITMGTRAIDYFRERGARAAFFAVSGGIDAQRYTPAGAAPAIDLILVARLAAVKRIDVFLDAIALARRSRPAITATIVGDGALRQALEAQSARLGLTAQVTFAGQQSDVKPWLRNARLFALTSDTEGLPLSVMEAMMCGLPVVASNVGDMGDLVADGVNGRLIPAGDAAAFADAIVGILADPVRLESMGRAARQSAEHYRVEATTATWDHVWASIDPRVQGNDRTCAA